MKQHITIDQLNELSEKARNKLTKWQMDNKGILYYKEYHNGSVRKLGPNEIKPELPSIGQLIEYLGLKIIFLENEADWWGIQLVNDNKIDPVPELCDALWEAVKEDLES